MKIWIGESKNLIKDCIDYLIKNYGASDYYNIKSKIDNPTYLEQVNYLYLLNNNTIGSGRDRDKFEAIKAKELHLHDILHISKQSIMSIENTKIWIGGDVEKSKKVQEILFKLGCKWSNGSTEVTKYNEAYLKVDNRRAIVYGNDKELFNSHTCKEISCEDLCQMYPTNTQPKFTITENSKIWVGDDKDLAREVQLRLFQLGYHWEGGSEVVLSENLRWISINVDKKIIYFGVWRETFEKNTEKELTYSKLFPPRSKAEEEAITTMGVYERGLLPKHLMCSCDVGEGKDSSINIFFDKLKGTKWEDCKNEDNFIQPSHLKRIEHSTKQIPSWGSKLYVIPPKGKMRPRIKAKRAWEIL